MEQQFLEQNWWILILVIWTLPWKGWALWKSALLKDKIWFIVFLFVNTVGILEILYIFSFSKRKKIESNLEDDNKGIE